MERYKLTSNLYLDEYIPKELYEKYHTRPHILIGLIDARLIDADQMLRNHFGPIIINNWWSGGERNWSGIRTPDSPYYSFTSQHSWGRASDKIFLDVSSEEVREYIKKTWQVWGITCIEEDVSWVHSDVRLIKNQTELLLVYP